MSRAKFWASGRGKPRMRRRAQPLREHARVLAEIAIEIQDKTRRLADAAA